MKRLALGGLGWALALCACSLIVPSELDPVLCSNEGAIGAPACPNGQQCVGGTCRSCGPAGCSPVGTIGDVSEPCRGDGTCSTALFCIEGAGLGVAPGTFCSRGCCSSEECGKGVCVPSTGGANVCVPAANVGRPKGQKARGSSCGGPADCASGLCEAGFCIDVCCGTSDCASSEGCVLRQIPGLSRLGFLCGPPGGSGDIGTQNCVSGDDCRTRACFTSAQPTYCSGPCCKRSECGSSGQMECIYDLDQGLRGCKVAATPPGPVAVGGACNDDADCASSQCVNFNLLGKLCSDSCCVDKDCGNPEQLACLPVAASEKTVLLCVPRQGSVN
ncbi:MAG: hypothetical protein R3B13_22570 [Polyangiaceae bacterium]